MSYIVIVLLILIFLFYFIVKPYFFRFDKVVLVTGGSGSGKTLCITTESIRKYKLNYKKAKIARFFRKKIELPKLVSNYPIYLGKKYTPTGFSYRLKKEHILQTELLPEGSIVVISELNKIASQWQFNEEIIKHYFNKFVSQGRHYFNGYIFADDQSESNVCNVYTRSAGSFLYCYDFKNIPIIPFVLSIGYHRCFKVPTSEEVKLILSKSMDSNSTNKFYIFSPLLKRKYDSRFMSEFYGHPNELTLAKQDIFNGYKVTDTFVLCDQKVR